MSTTRSITLNGTKSTIIFHDAHVFEKPTANWELIIENGEIRNQFMNREGLICNRYTFSIGK